MKVWRKFFVDLEHSYAQVEHPFLVLGTRLYGRRRERMWMGGESGAVLLQIYCNVENTSGCCSAIRKSAMAGP